MATKWTPASAAATGLNCALTAFLVAEGVATLLVVTSILLLAVVFWLGQSAR